MKRTVSVIVLVILCIGLLGMFACGNDTENSGSNVDTGDKTVIVTRFVVASDIHYGAGMGESERLGKLFSSSLEYAKSEAYKEIDGFFFVGDMTNHGSYAQYVEFFNRVNSAVGDIPAYYTLGNHEFFQDHDEQTFALACSQEVNFTTNVGEYMCICISPHHDGFGKEAVEYLSTELEKASKEDASKPVFVFFHQPVLNTLMGSDPWTSSNWEELDDILKEYPQAIVFSGHTHAPINNPLAIYQKDYTCVATGGLLAASVEGFEIPSYSVALGQYLIVEIDKDGVVYIKPYDVVKNSFCLSLATEGENAGKQLTFTVDVSNGKDGFTYVDRGERFIAPYFEEGARLKVVDAKPNTVKIEIPEAKTEDGVYYYVAEISDHVTTKTVKYCAGFYDSTKTGNDVIEITGLSDKINYDVGITPVDFYGNKGDTLSIALTIEQRT